MYSEDLNITEEEYMRLWFGESEEQEDEQSED